MAFITSNLFERSKSSIFSYAVRKAFFLFAKSKIVGLELGIIFAAVQRRLRSSNIFSKSSSDEESKLSIDWVRWQFQPFLLLHFLMAPSLPSNPKGFFLQVLVVLHLIKFYTLGRRKFLLAKPCFEEEFVHVAASTAKYLWSVVFQIVRV